MTTSTPITDPAVDTAAGTAAPAAGATPAAGAAGAAGAAATTPAAAGDTTTAAASAPLPAAAANATLPVADPFPVRPTLGTFGNVFDFPIIPVAVAAQPDGTVLTWAAWVPDDFDRVDRLVIGGGGQGLTQSAVFDPATNEITAFEVSNTDHDMFCPGISMLFSGDLIITGGQNALKTTLYRTQAAAFEPAEDMNLSRGYGSTVTLSDGNVRSPRVTPPSLGVRVCCENVRGPLWRVSDEIPSLAERAPLPPCLAVARRPTPPLLPSATALPSPRPGCVMASLSPAVQVFVLGGSWSGPEDLAKDAELYNVATDTWTLLPGIPASVILTADPEGAYRADNYGWFFSWSEGSGAPLALPLLACRTRFQGPVPR